MTAVKTVFVKVREIAAQPEVVADGAVAPSILEASLKTPLKG